MDERELRESEQETMDPTLVESEQDVLDDSFDSQESYLDPSEPMESQTSQTETSDEIETQHFGAETSDEIETQHFGTETSDEIETQQYETENQHFETETSDVIEHEQFESDTSNAIETEHYGTEISQPIESEASNAIETEVANENIGADTMEVVNDELMYNLGETNEHEDSKKGLELITNNSAIVADNDAPEHSNLMTIKREVTNSPELTPEVHTNHHLPTNKLSLLKESVEQKSSVLSNAWSELYSLLGEYKAELFSKQDISEKYDGSNVSQLKSELIDKDNEIVELRSQLDEFQKHAEKCQIDLSVKDSLLKKYQEDLLQKEASLLSTQSKVSRLENRLRALESRAQFDGPPRKIMRAPFTSRSPGLAGRPQMRSPLGISPRPTIRSGIMGRPSGVPRRRMPSPQVLSPQIRPSAPIQRRPPAPTRPPETDNPSSSEAPVICIEVDDDDELQQITDATKALETPETDPPVFPEWQESNNEFNQRFEARDINEGMLSQPSFSGESARTLDAQAWPVELTQTQQMQQLSQSTGANSKFCCQTCGVWFSQGSSLFRHIRIQHMGMKPFDCEICGHRFGQKHDLLRHKRIHQRSRLLDGDFVQDP